MVSGPIDPLDVSNITKTWPPWKQSFQIYITANYGDVLPDRRKLALFLYCLGPAGLAMANKMFPQLIDFDSAAAKQVRFVNIWNKFNSKAVSKKQMVQRSMVELLRGICPWWVLLGYSLLLN